MAVRPFHRQAVPDAGRRSRRPHPCRHRRPPARRPRGDRPHLGRACGVADPASTALRRRRRGAGRTWPAVRMLLQQKGYPAGTAGTARPAGRLSRNLPRPDRRRARDPTRSRGRPPALRLRTDVDHLYGSRSAARRIHRHRRRFRGPPRRRRGRLQPRRRRRRCDPRRRPGGARGRPAGVVAAPGLPREPDGPSRADVRTRRTGAQRGWGAAGQARRRGDARRDRRCPVHSNRSPARSGGGRPNLDEMLTRFDPAELPREPWIYSPT